ncbi:bacillithiol biosynthesis cysteine-adding enzyme BshC [Belliella kenyensis]|uniref:Putative cysteine ligase BshC n=1 Tax=Belliella kenyensis TaxID=1472724 RepID=A0ABV8EID7_9BACT|nr:bacillithiol biosynthesis cysteine-adding enzyme BshC [Belliella kenyensis]MCH7401300.1 bacillithiol biosynthesis cysteine-adding enzyme BshC [Belliella kenyensis]MDN3602745.1 bacillithiol biosynthesis cysteine-adding enzyme BshC [Belliella kenyensis]
MIKSTVDPVCTGQFSSLFLDYISEKHELKHFYSHFPKIENFEKLIASKNFGQSERELLVESLRRQYQSIEVSDTWNSQIESLKQPNTYTVTTGHQLNLFTGPLYFIYKIVSTINLARKLKSAYPSFHFVPVYWMGAEDHDFDEVNYFRLDGKKYQWESDQKGAVGEFEIDGSFKEFVNQLHFVPALFKEAYLSSKTLSEAARKYVHALFGEEGLIIIDGNDSKLKAPFVEVMKADMLDHRPFEKASEATQALEDLGYKSQIFPREINFFYMIKGLRERIEKFEDRYMVLNSDLIFSKEELIEEIKNYPERFSPNVVLRPLHQEMVLPNIAYLGGPAEVAYWFQLKGVFDHFAVPFPAVMPRNFAVVMDALAQKKQLQLGLSDEDLFVKYGDWKKQYVASHAILDIQLNAEKRELEEILTRAAEKATEVDKSLNGAFESAKVRSIKIMNHLSGKIRKAEERRQEVDLNRMRALKEMLFPGGSPQERVENMMRFYLEDDQFIAKLLKNFDPLDFNFLILKLQDE